MILIEKTQIMGLEPTIRGMRNPMNSWAKSDSTLLNAVVYFDECNKRWETNGHAFEIGPNDLDLMLRLAKAGSVDGKFRRMIVVYVDLTAPLYWWKEFDTYKVGTVANSCSTMHKIHAKEFTLDDFSHEHLIGEVNDGSIVENSPLGCLRNTVEMLNNYRDRYLKNPNKLLWWQMIQLLPSSYNQKRTVMLNYEVLANIYQHRRNHKLNEWRELCHWIEALPYSEVITCNATENDKSNALTSAIGKLKAELRLGDDQIAKFLLEQAKVYTGGKTVDVTSPICPNIF